MKPSKTRQEPESPAVITELHVRNRPYVEEIVDGREKKRVVASGKAWRKLSPLEQYHLQGRLAGGAPRHDATARFTAGSAYATLYATAMSSGRDSTQALNVSGGGNALPLSQSQSAAIRSLVVIDWNMGDKDRRIIRLVCGDGYFPSEAIRTVCGDYRDTIAARLREALDALIEAMDAAKRNPGKVSHGTHETNPMPLR